jgi:hypothetical protein
VHRASGMQITNVLPDTGRFVMPLEAQLLEPDIRHLCVGPPRMFPPIYYDEELDANIDPYEFAMETGRPVWVRCETTLSPKPASHVLGAHAHTQPMRMPCLVSTSHLDTALSMSQNSDEIGRLQRHDRGDS